MRVRAAGGRSAHTNAEASVRSEHADDHDVHLELPPVLRLDAAGDGPNEDVREVGCNHKSQVQARVRLGVGGSAWVLERPQR